MNAPHPRHPFEALTPDAVQDALLAVGLVGDGRLTALSSYENRVYQAHLDEAHEGHRAVVLKFYRPERWSLDQIQEEHQFAAELAQAEVPMVAPLVLGGQTLHQHGGFAFSVSPYRGGRRPELDDFEVLEWVGRFIARLHTVGARQPFAHRPALNAVQLAHEPRDWLLAHHMVPLDMQSRWEKALEQALKVLGQVAPCLLDGPEITSPSTANNSIPSSDIGQFNLKNEATPRLNPAEQRKLDAERRQKLAAATKPWRKELEKVDARLAAITAQQAELEDALTRPMPPADMATTGKTLKALAEEQDELEMRWLELTELIEQAELNPNTA